MKKKRWINKTYYQKQNGDSPIARQKRDQSLKIECIFNLLKEGKLIAEENICYNKDLCIKLKEIKTDTSHLKNYFIIKMQEKFYCFCYTNVKTQIQ